MAAPNQSPVWSRVGSLSTNNSTGMSQLVLAAANDYTGIDSDVTLVWTADATNGGWLQRLRFKAGGTNVATVARIYLNNGSSNGTATNNAFYGELSLPATTAIATAATVDIDYPINFAFDPGFRIYVGYATAIAAGWVCTGVGGKY